MTRIELILNAILAIAECFKEKKRERRKQAIKNDIQAFFEAVAKRDTDTISRMLHMLAIHRIDRKRSRAITQ